MNRSRRNPDAYGEIREDASVLGRTCGYCNFTGDMMSYAQHVCPRDVMQSEIDSLRAQLAAATERERAARQLLIDAHEPDQGQQRTEWDERVDAWLRAQPASDGQEPQP